MMLRIILNLFDRKMLKDLRMPFVASMFLNSLFPFLYALLFFYFKSPDSFFSSLNRYLLNPYAILSGMLSYWMAYVFCLGFRYMSVRSVVLSAKGADLIIPFVLCIVGKSLDLKGLIFSFCTVLSFIPVFYGTWKKQEPFHFSIIVAVILSLVGTAYLGAVSHFSHETIDHFICFFTVLSFWRLICGLLHLICTTENKAPDHLKLPIKLLFARGGIAFLSQITFIYVVTSGAKEAIYAWPILNSGPLFATAVAHFAIHEKISKEESFSFIIFTFVVMGWIASY